MYFTAITQAFTAPQTQHSHTGDEVLFCQAEEERFLCGGQTLILLRGDLVCIPGGTPHSATPHQCVDLCLRTTEPPFTEVTCLHDIDGSFSTLLELAWHAAAVGTPNWIVLARGLGNVILRLLICMRSDDSRRGGAAFDLWRTIQEHGLEQDFDLLAAMRQTGYCVNYLRQMFKAAYGMPPKAYLNEYRIGYAKALLRGAAEPLPICEVGRRCGFRDPYYFSRLFRRQAGVSPTEYIAALERTR